MKSHTSTDICTSSVSQEPDALLLGHQANKMVPDRKHRRKVRKDDNNPPTMLSDPLDSSSSDAQSFDEDDMYGSDSGVETISLKPDSNNEARETEEMMVCVWLIKSIQDI
jgi:hypothetical protein